MRKKTLAQLNNRTALLAGQHSACLLMRNKSYTSTIKGLHIHGYPMKHIKYIIARFHYFLINSASNCCNQMLHIKCGKSETDKLERVTRRDPWRKILLSSPFRRNYCPDSSGQMTDIYGCAPEDSTNMSDANQTQKKVTHY